MNKQKLLQILNDGQVKDIYYDAQPVWIQSVKDDIAHIGFLNGQDEKDVYIDDLYERDLYN